MVLGKQKLEQLKEVLVARRKELVTQLEGATAGHIEGKETFNDAVDQASAETDKDFELSMQNHLRAALVRIEGALKRVAAGTFGECIECGESIPEARLLAHPETTLCIDCKAELESEKKRPER